MKPNTCCNDERNLSPAEDYGLDGRTFSVTTVQPPEPAPLTFRRCVVCGCRHFEAVAEIGDLKMTGAGIG